MKINWPGLIFLFGGGVNVGRMIAYFEAEKYGAGMASFICAAVCIGAAFYNMGRLAAVSRS